MNEYTISSYKQYKILFQGHFKTAQACIEAAIDKGIDLSYARLKHLDLSNITLDGGKLAHADFSGSNLTGANLSEADLRGALFSNCGLSNVCFAYSNLQGCDFSGASFGATDITGSNISFAKFTTLSCFSLDFTHARLMKDCIFESANDTVSRMSKPPVVIKGIGAQPIILMDDHVSYGHNSFEYKHMMEQIQKFVSVEVLKKTRLRESSSG